jgi:L-rhamnose mutarotase
MNRYCFVIEINESQVEDYVNLHKNPWRETLEALKAAGAAELLIYNYKNFSVLFWEAEDLNEVYRKWGATKTCEKWNARLAGAYKVTPSIDGSSDVATCEKIFDLNQQLNGELKQF